MQGTWIAVLIAFGVVAFSHSPPDAMAQGSNKFERTQPAAPVPAPAPKPRATAPAKPVTPAPESAAPSLGPDVAVGNWSVTNRCSWGASSGTLSIAKNGGSFVFSGGTFTASIKGGEINGTAITFRASNREWMGAFDLVRQITGQSTIFLKWMRAIR